MPQAISSNLASIIDQIPGACGCKDEQSTFLHANQEFKAIAGLRPEDSIAGLTDFDLPGEMAVHAQTFREQDQYVLQRKTAMTTFNVYRMKCARINAFLVTKKPFLDQETQTSGVLFHLTDMSALNTGLLGPYRSNAPRIFNDLSHPGGVSYVIAGGDTDITDKMDSETWILQHGHYQIEVMANLDKVPAKGALIVVTWPKVKKGLGFPARAFAILP